MEDCYGIETYYLNDLSICDDHIKAFNSQEAQQYHIKGRCAGENGVINSSPSKVSTDMPFAINTKFDFCVNYLNELSEFLNQYLEKYPRANATTATFSIKRSYQLQYYKPTEGFFKWHTERSGSPETQNRHLVFMTYLNDVTDGGETEWELQNLKVSARKGKTLIWPVDWMFTHRGITSPTQEKYILTGWYTFDE